MHKNTAYLVLVLVFLLIIAIVLQLVSSKNSSEQTKGIPVTQQNNKLFSITQTSVDPQKSLSVGSGVILTFSQPLSLANFRYELIPSTALQITINGANTEVTMKPQDNAWKYGSTYQLTIKEDTQSLSGQKLQGDFIVNFTTERRSGI